ncbi:hypothetical protein Lepto7375DRAFT_2002 [Leptolyngbya sp. PCC 7375]|nr:hypothetical protein Lepto7375DRAFT_2002 [Leptolyngbya sp. PCC 7375]
MVSIEQLYPTEEKLPSQFGKKLLIWPVMNYLLGNTTNYRLLVYSIIGLGMGGNGFL